MSGDARLNPEFSIVAHSADTVELRTGVWNVRSLTLSDDTGQGRLLALLTGLREGRMHADIARSAAVPRSHLESLLDTLSELGLLVTGPTSALQGFLDRSAARSLDPGNANSPATVTVVGTELLVERVVDQLSDLGSAGTPVLVGDRAWKELARLTLDDFADGLRAEAAAERFTDLAGSLVVLATDHLDPIRTTLLNRIALHHGFTWISGTLDGPLLYVGPTVVPGRSACYECFETRVTMNLRERESYRAYKHAIATGRATGHPEPIYRPLTDLLTAHLALEVTNQLCTGTGFTTERVLSIYLPTMEIAYQDVLRVPSCAACGPLMTRDSTALYFDIRDWLDD